MPVTHHDDGERQQEESVADHVDRVAQPLRHQIVHDVDADVLVVEQGPGAHSRNTALNSTHCSSSQEFDDISKILRMVALAADTTTATRISQAHQRPMKVLTASIARLSPNSALTVRPPCDRHTPATSAAPFGRRSRAGHGSGHSLTQTMRRPSSAAPKGPPPATGLTGGLLGSP